MPVDAYSKLNAQRVSAGVCFTPAKNNRPALVCSEVVATTGTVWPSMLRAWLTTIIVPSQDSRQPGGRRGLPHEREIERATGLH